MNDIYQERYLAHQKRKAEVLREIMKERHSTRVFSDTPVDESLIKEIQQSIEDCPSSCDRAPVWTKVITDRDNKSLLGGLLVGGVGWVHRAPTVLMIFTDETAYKEGLNYMPYLDVGVVIETIYLKCTSLGLKCCYINPQVRDENKKYFNDRFVQDKNMIYGGAFAIGYEKE